MLQVRAIGALRLGDFLAQLPQRLQLRQRSRDRRVEAQLALQRCADHALEQRVERVLIRGVRQFHQHIGGVALRERFLHACRVCQHQVQAFAGKELERLQARAALREQQFIQFQRLRRRGHCRQHHAARIGAREQPQRRRRDHAQRAFRADQQLLQVVAGVVLAQRAQAVEHLAVGQHGFDAQYQFARHAIAHHVDAAGIGGQVAADLA
ncbi:hypothetical protein D3C81_1174460 [compost metagenome]